MSAMCHWIPWNCALACPNCSRCFAYAIASSYAPCAIPRPSAPIAMRPPSSVISAFTYPSPSAPRRFSAGTRQPSRRTCEVADARIPSLSSIFPTWSPGVPFSTMNALRPGLPLGGSVLAVRTKVPATGAFVQKFFEPFRTYASPSRVAVVFMPAASEPTEGSVRPHAPIFLPAAKSGTYLRFCSSFAAMRMFPVHSPLCAAKISRHKHAEKAELSHLHDSPRREFAGGVELARDRLDLLFRELPHVLSYEVHLGRRSKIHGAEKERG